MMGFLLGMEKFFYIYTGCSYESFQVKNLGKIEGVDFQGSGTIV
jgi:hypothetical protein